LRIELGARVREIRWTRSGASALTSGRTWEARRAVVTLPLGVLQEGTVRFVPALPRWKQEAIDALAMGPVVKTALLFERPFWPADLAFLISNEDGCRPSGGRCPRGSRPSSAGPRAARPTRLRGRDVVAAAVSSLSRVVGRRVRPIRSLAFDWQRDHLSRGAYSWVPVGALKQQRALARQVGPLHFAGEGHAFRRRLRHGARSHRERVARRARDPAPAVKLPSGTGRP